MVRRYSAEKWEQLPFSPRSSRRKKGAAPIFQAGRSVLEQAQRFLVGGVNSPVRAFRHVGGDPLLLTRAHGAEVVDHEGRTFLDFIAGWGALLLGHNPPVVVAALRRGLEQGTLFRVSEIVTQELGSRSSVAVLSGPSFAAEVARRLPTAVSVACPDGRVVEQVQAEFRAPYFRLYGTDDVIGVEIGGAIKNVIAIAAGVAEGLGLGHNAQAGLITRGLAEISRLACAAGAKRETLAGLTGLGDLVLTCTGTLSRNRHVGVELASGRTLQDILAGMKMVAEGVRTTDAALALAARHGVELPIAAQVAELLAGRKDARTGLEELMLRPQRAETG